MGKIVVIDSMCGRGKTQWALQNINAHPNEAVIYASPPCYQNSTELSKERATASYSRTTMVGIASFMTSTD